MAARAKGGGDEEVQSKARRREPPAPEPPPPPRDRGDSRRDAAGPSLPGFTPDTDGGADHLDIRADVGAFAAVVASKAVRPPLSIGLFGPWGSGKSFFMRKLRERIEVLASASAAAEARGEESAFCSRVVSIVFNAWHYVDADLWASLATHIFEDLARQLAPEEEAVADTRRKLVERLESSQALRAEAEEALADARRRRLGAEAALREAREARRSGQREVLAAALASDPALREALDGVSRRLGLPGAFESAEALREGARQARERVGRAGTVLRAMLQGPDRRARIAVAALVLAAPLVHFGVHRLATALRLEDAWFPQIAAAVAGLSTFLAAVREWISRGLAHADDLLGRYGSACEALERRIAESASAADSTLSARVAEEEEAARRLAEAEVLVQEAHRALGEIERGRRLRAFLAERARSDEYRRHLGLVHVIRRDLEQLGLLLDPEAPGETDLPPVGRIVLFIDDLDRCPEARVVEVLQAVHLLLAFPLFVVVVAVDPRWVRRSLERQYEEVIDDGGAGPAAGRSAPHDLGPTPQDYLEKILQVPFNLRPIHRDAFARLVRALVSGGDGGEEGGGDGGAPPEPAEVDVRPPGLVLHPHEVDFLARLGPLVPSPRRAKRLVNLYLLMRARLEGGELARFVDAGIGEHRAAMVLLATVVGQPHVAGPVLGGLASSIEGQWWPYLRSVSRERPDPPEAERAEWIRVQEARDALDLPSLPLPPLSVFARWAGEVSRFTVQWGSEPPPAPEGGAGEALEVGVPLPEPVARV